MEMSFEIDGDDFVIVPSAYGASSSNVKPPPELLPDISHIVDGFSAEFWPINKKIHDHPEQGYKEFIAHDVLTGFMSARPGWVVTPHAYGMATAWVAVYDSGKKGTVVSFNAEMDCLPGIGHACGHNLIATVSVLGAVATAEMMKSLNIAGKVVLYGTPAEEGGGGKIKLLEAGAYSDHKVDISLISHPGSLPDAALMTTTAYRRFKVEYFGREAHAAAAPWEGINALDGLISGYNNVSMLRQQITPDDRIHGMITHGGLATNIIHAYAAGVFMVRSSSQSRLDELKKKTYECFEAGARATGAKAVITEGNGYKTHVPNRPLGKSYTRYFNALNPPIKIAEDQAVDEARGKIQASTDQGDISHAMPSLSVAFSIEPGPDGEGPHNPGFAKSAGTFAAYERSLRAAKGLAGVALDVLCSKKLLEEVRKDWNESMRLQKRS